MDDKEKLEPYDDDSLKSQDVIEASKEYIKRIKEEVPQPQDGAGPSSELPGAVLSEPRANLQRQLSKSEHNIRHITAQDLENALKSFKISPNFETIQYKNILKNLDIPMIHTINEKKEIRPSLTDAQNISLTVCNEIQQNCAILTAAENVQPAQSNPHTNILQVVSNPNPIVSSNVQTDAVAVINLKNEVLFPESKPVDNKLSKDSKKKNSGSLSERSDIPLGQRDSLSSIGSNVCRICMTKGRERLISPCNCKGSLANVHLSCLERWLNQVGRNHCELCGFSYPAIRTPRYTVLQALRLWFGNPRNRSHLQSDCLIFWLLSTVTAGLLAVCIVGTQYFVIEGSKFGKHDGHRKDEGISHRITETAMDFFMAIVLCGYSVTVYLLWKDHYVMWNRWRRANVNVRLLLSPDSNPVPFVPRPAYRIV